MNQIKYYVQILKILLGVYLFMSFVSLVAIVFYLTNIQDIKSYYLNQKNIEYLSDLKDLSLQEIIDANQLDKLSFVVSSSSYSDSVDPLNAIDKISYAYYALLFCFVLSQLLVWTTYFYFKNKIFSKAKSEIENLLDQIMPIIKKSQLESDWWLDIIPLLLDLKGMKPLGLYIQKELKVRLDSAS